MPLARTDGWDLISPFRAKAVLTLRVAVVAAAARGACHRNWMKLHRTYCKWMNSTFARVKGFIGKIELLAAPTFDRAVQEHM